jgi:hypothetical protein
MLSMAVDRRTNNIDELFQILFVVIGSYVVVAVTCSNVQFAYDNNCIDVLPLVLSCAI